MCLNKKVLVGLAAVGLGVAVLRPGWVAVALPLLVLALCPLSMVFMMRGMKGDRVKDRAGSACATGATTRKAAETSGAELDDKISALQAELRSLKATQAQREITTPAVAEESVRLTKDTGPGPGTRA
ncbi:DUF2933 domain-containing protein [Streptomyces sp. H27-S2]|uniref:DUF2933 domain-containing protein n=1 Tax=Streptomyces antarcticus TaxID=2996458 RepID=UPI00226EBCC6|nr:DUF2933 domain-containing protein [Streptomyces sp. H27-S2]MCY0955154.1 DUF2933 domain-containing protein [Streptomyces sp. H27-S2]